MFHSFRSIQRHRKILQNNTCERRLLCLAIRYWTHLVSSPIPLRGIFLPLTPQIPSLWSTQPQVGNHCPKGRYRASGSNFSQFSREPDLNFDVGKTPERALGRFWLIRAYLSDLSRGLVWRFSCIVLISSRLTLVTGPQTLWQGSESSAWRHLTASRRTNNSIANS